MKEYCVYIALILLLFIYKAQSSCILKVSEEFGKYAPILLNETNNKFIYPEKSNPKVVEIKVNDNVVANCPDNSIRINGVSIKQTYVILSCVGDTSFKVSNGIIYKFKEIRCAARPNLITKQIGQCANGKLIKIGFKSILSAFISIVDICYNKDTAGAYWAHSQMYSEIYHSEHPLPLKQYPTVYKADELPKNIEVASAYFKEEQRKTLLEIMSGNQELVDKYMPLTGNTFLSRGLLVRKADQFYQTLQHSSQYHINALPIWQSIMDGNWKRIEKDVRTLAAATGSIDVYTGGLYTLELPFSSTDNREIFLARNKKTGAPAVFVPRLLFKLIFNQKQRKAMVYITINNPFLATNNIPGNYMICREFKECSLKDYAVAKDTKIGYSYCCLYKDFIKDVVAGSIGLPILSDVEPLIL